MNVYRTLVMCVCLLFMYTPQNINIDHRAVPHAQAAVGASEAEAQLRRRARPAGKGAFRVEIVYQGALSCLASSDCLLKQLWERVKLKRNYGDALAQLVGVPFE